MLTHNGNCAVDYDDKPVEGPLDSTRLLGDVPQDARQQEVDGGESGHSQMLLLGRRGGLCH